MQGKAAFTIIARNYLAQARTLAKSIRELEPDVDFYVLLIDEGEITDEPFEVVYAKDIGIYDQNHLFFKYKTIELATAVKPHFIKFLLDKGHNKVLYFDPDILVCDKLDYLWDTLNEWSIILTPHMLEPPNDMRKQNEVDVGMCGVYNLGFIGVSQSHQTTKFLDWWSNRTYLFCLMEPRNGLFVDQKWIDHVPCYYDEAYILREPAYNVAYWNLHERGEGLALEDDGVYLYGEKVKFFHFSGYDPYDNVISKHQERFTFEDLPNIKPIYEMYTQLLIGNGYDKVQKHRPAYDYFDNGILVSEFIRMVYRNLPNGSYFGNPFDTISWGNFYHWLRSDVINSNTGEKLPISNLMYKLWQRVPELQEQAKELNPDTVGIIASWINTHTKVTGIDPIFGRRLMPIINENPNFGVNIAGYMKGVFGVGQAARNTVFAVQTTDVPYAINNVSCEVQRSDDCTFDDEFTDDNPYSINIVHINADQTGVFANLSGHEYFEERYNIGLWFWELEDFPKEWHRYFAFYDEIWTKSEFVRDAIAKVSPLPTYNIPNTVYIDKEINPDRRMFNLRDDVFIFLFAFDYFSVFQRKNPLAVIEAFKKAFGDSRDVMLIIKSINAEPYQKEYKATLDASQNNNNIVIWNRSMSWYEMLTLTKSVDCFVSLHRSEGFGQGLAEAMLLGVPVMATAYSGNMEFMNHENSWLVDYEIVDIKEDHFPYTKGNVWADADTDHAAEVMKEIYSNKDLATKKAKIAKKYIEDNYSHKAIGKMIKKRLSEIERNTLSIATNVPPPAECDIVIPAFGKPDLLEKCVDSVLATTSNVNIIIVNDRSPEPMDHLIEKYEKYPNILWINLDRNRGFLGATDIGAAYGASPNILFMNSDIEAIEDGWLEKILPDGNEIVGAKLLFPPEHPLEGRIQHIGVTRRNDGVPYHPCLGWDAEKCGNERKYMNAVTGGLMMIPRELWLELEGWDSDFGKGVYEDVDLCWRAREKGYKVRYEPVVFYHYSSASKPENENHTLYVHLEENLNKLLTKHRVKSDEDLFFGKVSKSWYNARYNLERAAEIKGTEAGNALVRKAKRLAPELPEVQYAYAKMLAQELASEEAIEWYKKAIENAPLMWEARVELIDLLIAEARIKEALDEFNEVKAIFPEIEQLADKQKLLEVFSGLDGDS